MSENFGPALEVDADPAPPAPAGRGRAARAVIGGGIGAFSAASIATITLGAQALLEDYLPVYLTALKPENVPIVAAGAVALAGLVAGGIWGLLGPAVRRALGAAVVAGIAFGCAGQLWPPAMAFGQSEIQQGPCERFYDQAGALTREKCDGAEIRGGAISDNGANVVGGTMRAVRSTAAELLGIPQMPPTPPKVPGP